MIVGKDTLPFKATLSISRDTTYKSGLTYITADTSYEDPCYKFEKRNGVIINRTDNNCLQQGLWITPDSTGSYTTSYYTNGDNNGEWRYYSKKGQLIKKVEEAEFGKDSYIVKEIDYSNGHPVIVRYVPFFKFIIENFAIVLAILIVSIFIRTLVNNKIYNVENGTTFSFIRTKFRILPKLMDSNELKHRILCFVTLWFFKYKPENKYDVIISNLLSIIIFGGFSILIVGQAICSKSP
jgi:hypothetical protein